MKTINLVAQFHEAFEQPIMPMVSIKDPIINELRASLLEEETRELREALAAKDPVAVLDALTDIQYVLDGAFLAFGLHPWKDSAMTEVHRSNMSKLGEDGKPVKREDGKVLKGPNYTPPDLAAVLSGNPFLTLSERLSTEDSNL